MAKVAAFLRGINVGGKVMVSMGELKTLLEKAGFGEVRSLLNSGNLVFEAGKRSGAGIEKLIEEEIEKRLNLKVDVMVRGDAELRAVLTANPFEREAREDPSHVVVMFLKDVPKTKSVEGVRAAIKGREKVVATGRELYITYPDGIGTSKLTNAIIEKNLNLRGTARNWNTLLKVVALLQG